MWASSGDGTRAAVFKELVAAPGESVEVQTLTSMVCVCQHEVQEQESKDNTGMSLETPSEHESLTVCQRDI